MKVGLSHFFFIFLHKLLNDKIIPVLTLNADSSLNLDLSLAIAPTANSDGFQVQPGWMNMPVDGSVTVMWRNLVQTSCSIQFLTSAILLAPLLLYPNLNSQFVYI